MYRLQYGLDMAGSYWLLSPIRDRTGNAAWPLSFFATSSPDLIQADLLLYSPIALAPVYPSTLSFLISLLKLRVPLSTLFLALFLFLSIFHNGEFNCIRPFKEIPAKHTPTLPGRLKANLTSSI